MNLYSDVIAGLCCDEGQVSRRSASRSPAKSSPCTIPLSALLSVAFLGASGCVHQNLTRGESYQAMSQPSDFQVRDYGGKCLDYGMSPPGHGGTVFLNDCNSAHTILVEEINSNHQVLLHAGAQVIGIHNPNSRVTGSVPAAVTATTFSLELQPPFNSSAEAGASDPANQLFYLDGDSIILGSSMPEPQLTPKPVLVVQVSYDDSRGWRFSHIVVAPRALADSEFWDFNATDRSGRDPTSGFLRASNRNEFLNALNIVAKDAQAKGAAWGDVIRIMSGPIDLSAQPGVTIEPGAAIALPGATCPPLDPGQPQGYFCDHDGTVHQIPLPTGVTVRGDRRGVNPGALLFGNYCPPPNDPKSADCGFYSMFQITGDYVRITALRLQGPSQCVKRPEWCQSVFETYLNAIVIGLNPEHLNQQAQPTVCAKPDPNGLCPQPVGVVIDHNEIFDWPEAVAASDQHLAVQISDWPFAQCNVQPDSTLNDRLHVDRNFFHHNENDTVGGGYGVVLSQGATATILGNTFLMNRHSIAGEEGDTALQYSAWGNLVLSSVPQHAYSPQQDFDMHGEIFHNRNGGFAGSQIDILWNTFLGGNRANFWLRGAPCNFSSTAGGILEPVDRFGWNVTMNQKDTVHLFDYCRRLVPSNTTEGVVIPYNGQAPEWPAPTWPPQAEGCPEHHEADASCCVYSSTLPLLAPYLIMSGNKYASANPANRLGVGDFDGDGYDDLFLATGAAWYYAPGGKAEWRYLNGGKTDTIDSLLLGDFDGDGRTDVVGINPSGQLVVSWGGISDWVILNSNLPFPCTSVSDMAVGDFNGDGLADIFCADGKQWWISYGGSSSFRPAAASSFRVNQLRFGHFAICGTGKETDVFSIQSTGWFVSCGGTQPWKSLPVSSPSQDITITQLLIADFDGNGNADIADIGLLQAIGSEGIPWIVNISFDAARPWMRFTINWDTDWCSPLHFAPLLAGVGRFAGNKGSDVLTWGSANKANGIANNPNGICIAPGGNQTGQVGWTAGLSPYKLQDGQEMR